MTRFITGLFFLYYTLVITSTQIDSEWSLSSCLSSTRERDKFVFRALF